MGQVELVPNRALAFSIDFLSASMSRAAIVVTHAFSSSRVQKPSFQLVHPSSKATYSLATSTLCFLRDAVGRRLCHVDSPFAGNRSESAIVTAVSLFS